MSAWISGREALLDCACPCASCHDGNHLSTSSAESLGYDIILKAYQKLYNLSRHIEQTCQCHRMNSSAEYITVIRECHSEDLKRLAITRTPDFSDNAVTQFSTGCCRQCTIFILSVARYCSRECQKHDWKAHKPLCKKLASIRRDGRN